MTTNLLTDQHTPSTDTDRARGRFSCKLGRLSRTGWLVAVLPQIAHARLATTCFRGTQHQRAGNFRRWNEPALLFRELGRLLNVRLQPIAQEHLRSHPENPLPDIRVTLTYSHPVGWSSTDDIHDYPEGMDMELRPLNTRAEALFVPPDSGYLAPLTNLVTFVGTLRPPNPHDPPNWAFVIYTIYPGADVGRLEGNLSAERGVVYFDWNHPGEPLLSRV